MAVTLMRAGPSGAVFAGGWFLVAMAGCGAEAESIDALQAGPPELFFSEPAIDFGLVPVAQTRTRRFVLSNLGESPVVIRAAQQNVPLCANRAGPFCVSGPPPLATGILLTPGGRTDLSVSVLPEVLGPVAAELTIECVDADCSGALPLAATAIAESFTCGPSPLTLSAPVGQCAADAVVCRNMTLDAVTVAGWSLAPDASSTLRPMRNRTLVVQAGDTASVDVEYCPTAPSVDEGILVLRTDSSVAREVRVALRGDSRGPALDVAPRLGFGRVAVGSGVRRSIEVRNLGGMPLTLTTATATPSLFSIVSRDAEMIAPNGRGSIVVEVLAEQVGFLDGRLTLTSDGGDAVVDLTADAIDLPSCAYALEPTALDFGQVAPYQRRRRTVLVRNTGSDRCLLTQVRLTESTDSAYSLPDGDARSIVIEPGAAQAVAVEFAPVTAGSQSAELELTLSNPRRPTVVLPITAQVAAQAAVHDFLVAPDTVDFGIRGVGCATEMHTIRVHNLSDAVATVQTVSTTTAAFTVVPPRLPLVLDPGTSASWTVAMDRADAITDVAGAVRIEAVIDGAPHTYFVGLEGRRRSSRRQIDRWLQPGTAADALWVTDTRDSLVSAQIVAVADTLESVLAIGPGLQLGVAATEGAPNIGELCGEGTDRIITPTTSQFGIQEKLTCRSLGEASLVGAGLEAMRRALRPSFLGGPNQGLLRPDTTRSVVIVSGRDDISPASLDAYRDVLLSMVGFTHPDRIFVLALVGPMDGCVHPWGPAVPGLRYTQFARSMGGEASSICAANWRGGSNAALGAALRGSRWRWPLTQTPVGSVRVTVSGQQVPQHSGGMMIWDYDAGANEVRFLRPVVEPGADVALEYTTQCL